MGPRAGCLTRRPLRLTPCPNSQELRAKSDVNPCSPGEGPLVFRYLGRDLLRLSRCQGAAQLPRPHPRTPQWAGATPHRALLSTGCQPPGLRVLGVRETGSQSGGRAVSGRGHRPGAACRAVTRALGSAWAGRRGGSPGRRRGRRVKRAPASAGAMLSAGQSVKRVLGKQHLVRCARCPGSRPHTPPLLLVTASWDGRPPPREGRPAG